MRPDKTYAIFSLVALCYTIICYIVINYTEIFTSEPVYAYHRPKADFRASNQTRIDLQPDFLIDGEWSLKNQERYLQASGGYETLAPTNVTISAMSGSSGLHFSKFGGVQRKFRPTTLSSVIILITINNVFPMIFLIIYSIKSRNIGVSCWRQTKDVEIKIWFIVIFSPLAVSILICQKAYEREVIGILLVN
jgi:hypothetical protein